MITVKHLSKGFGGNLVLKDVCCEINQGDVISIIGPSGTGKSTFLRCLNLMERPDGGEIIVDGQNLLDKKTDINKVRQKMGMVFQSFNLYEHLMVIENLMLAPIQLHGLSRQEAYDEGMKLLDLVRLKEKALSYPDELSGGQKQRVAIARALAMKPEIILFDEPTSALDPTMVGEVLAVIRKLAGEGMTMIIVTHEMKFAHDVSNRVFFMRDGIIYEEGTPKQIFENPQKPLTRVFIRRIHAYENQISSRDFDYYALNDGIEDFGRRSLMTEKRVHNIELVTEELLLNEVLPLFPADQHILDIHYMLEYSDLSGNNLITIDYPEAGGYLPEKEDDLSMMIIQKIGSDLSQSIENDRRIIRLFVKDQKG